MQQDNKEEKELLEALKQDDEKGMQLIFNRYYKYLVVTSYNIIKDDHSARDLVQDVLFEFWKKRATINISSSLKAYLRRSVYNRSIDFIRKHKVRWEEPSQNIHQEEVSAQQQMETTELQDVINKAIDSLPNKCRNVFALSRFENLSHKEIAAQLDISTKTIENQITKALKIIRAAINKHGISVLVLTGTIQIINFLISKASEIGEVILTPVLGSNIFLC